ncbi:MAG: hypothetical protein, partial [Olavius algarvensis Gamma 1 endosymbiont]
GGKGKLLRELKSDQISLRSHPFHEQKDQKKAELRVSPCSGCETGHPSPPFALRSGDNLYVPRTP